MQIKAKNAPAGAFEIRNITASMCEIALFENVQETLTQNEKEAEKGFEWNEYTMQAVYRAGLENKIAHNTAAWLALAKRRETDGLASAARQKRDELLSDCDWTVLGDAKTTKTDWKTYRQALRDVPEQAAFPWAIDWPVMPV
ncbi:MAG: tail fiber assembly protein [Ruthenibacterium sp.]